MDYSDFLMHHGVKGMKWGVRKDQKIKDRIRRKRDKEKLKDIKNKRREAIKNRQALSDDELNRLVRRMQVERQAKDLYKNDSTNAGRYVNMVTSPVTKGIVGAVTAITLGAATVAGTVVLSQKLIDTNNSVAQQTGSILLRKLIKSKK